MLLQQRCFAAQSTQDIGWPRQISKNGAQLIYYQPQIKEWNNYKELTAELAFSLTPGGGKAVRGVASVHAFSSNNKETRTVTIENIVATSVRFSGVDAGASGPLEELFRQLLPGGGEPISLDRLLSELDRSKSIGRPVAVNNDPPPIFYSAKPAILLVVDGKPVQAPIENTNLEFIVNTNWDLFFEKSKSYYLLDQNNWLTAPALNGPWSRTQTLPKDMVKLPANENWTEVKKMIPPPQSSGAIPQVIFSNVPAELLLFKGEPIYTRISGTSLLYAGQYRQRRLH